ncbi:MAG: RNA polymerase sigma factor [Candidatus Uhrbacteria bacterium]
MTDTESGITACDEIDFLGLNYMQGRERYPQLEEFDFERFFSEQHRDISRFVAMRISDAQDAQDIVAEAMCQMLEYCKRQENSVRQHRALLYTITRRRIVDYYEGRSERVREVSIETASEIPTPGSLAQNVEAAEDLRRVREAIAALREDQRELIVLHAEVGLSIEEMAELMSCSRGVIRTRLHRARTELKRELRRNEERAEKEQETRMRL